MSELQLKYNLLDTTSQIQVKDFVDFLLHKGQHKIVAKKEEYKSKLLKVSTWSSSDINFLEENSKKMNQWKIEEW
ncbi:MAG: hypothetical protein AAF849_18705 [Bacteroidota bacterium]